MEGKKIKICALATISKTMDWFVVDAMRNLSKNGYDVTLVCNMDEKFISENEDYAKCVPLPMKRGASVTEIFKNVKALKKLFKKERYDVLFYTSPNASMYASMAGKSAKIPTRIYSQCGLRYVSLTGLKRKIFKWVEKFTCKNSTHVRAVSPMNMQYAIDEGLTKKDKISVIGIGGTTGVDLKTCDAFDHKQTRTAIREKYGIPQDAFLYGFVGRLNKDKGVNELVEAYSEVQKTNANAYLMLVGMNDDTNPVTEENAKKIQEDNKIIATGNVPKDEVYAYMSAFDVLVHPTYREGYGKVLQEAMGMHLPIITTDVIGPCEVVDHGEYGLLVPAKDAVALVQKMQEIERDENLRDTLSKKGRARAEKYYDRPIMLNNILEEINAIVAKNNKEKGN